MMAFRVNPSLPNAKTSEGRQSGSHRGPDAPGYQKYTTFSLGGGGGFRQSQIKLNLQPLSRYTHGKPFFNHLITGGTEDLLKVVRPRAANLSDMDISGRHFLFDKPCKKCLTNCTCLRFDRNRPDLPPLSRDYSVEATNLQLYQLSKEFSQGNEERPLTLGYPRKYEANTSPAVLFPNNFVISGKNTFSVGNSKHTRPKLSYPSFHSLTGKDHHKDDSYQDPMIGAPHSFLHRVTEISSLQGDTVRQENLKKLKKSKKSPS